MLAPTYRSAIDAFDLGDEPEILSAVERNLREGPAPAHFAAYGTELFNVTSVLDGSTRGPGVRLATLGCPEALADRVHQRATAAATHSNRCA